MKSDISGGKPNYQQEFRRALLLAVVFALPACLAIRLAMVSDFDVWWHLRTGQWIVQHLAVPSNDPFSLWGMSRSWVAYSWLFELLIYGLFRGFGLVGILAYQVGMLLAITAALFHLVHRIVGDPARSVALTAAGMLAMGPLYTPRPWLLSILLFIIEVHVLLKVRRERRFRPLLLLPPLFAIWANVNIQFISGRASLGVAAIEPLGARILRRWGVGTETTGVCPKPFWQCFAACVIATLINPYGWAIYRVVLEYSQQTAVSYIQEFQPISFWSLSGVCFLVVTFAAVWSLASKRERDPFSILLLVAAAGLSFRFARDVWVMAVAGVAITASNARPSTVPYRPDRRQWAFIAAIVCAIIAITSKASHVSNTSLERMLAREFPAAAAVQVAKAAYPGPLYNDLNWGGYLIWSLPLRPVSIDGRTNLHGDSRIDRSVRTWSAQHDWTSDPELLRARLIIGPLNAPLCAVLRLQPQYQLVYEDEITSVFVRGGGTAGLPHGQ